MRRALGLHHDERGRALRAVRRRGRERDRDRGPGSRRPATARGRRPPFPLLGGHHAFHTPIDFTGDTLYLRTDLGPRRAGHRAHQETREAAQPMPLGPEVARVIETRPRRRGRRSIPWPIAEPPAAQPLDGAGKGRSALPGIERWVGRSRGKPSAPYLYYSFASFLAPSTVYHHDLRPRKSECPAARLPLRISSATRRTLVHRHRQGRCAGARMFITPAKGPAARRQPYPPYSPPTRYRREPAARLQPIFPLWHELGVVYAVATCPRRGEYGGDWIHRAGIAWSASRRASTTSSPPA
jgi:hypothetical protein